MSPLCAVVSFRGVPPPRSVSSPSLSHASLLCLASSFPLPKVTFPDASSSVSKSCDSFLSVTFVDPSFPASLSGGFVEVPLPASVSSPSNSLSMSLSPFGEVVSLVNVGVFSSTESMRFLTAMCSPWSLVWFQICSILGDSSGFSLRIVIIGVHALCFGCAASPSFAAPFLDHIQIGFLTCVCCRLYLIMGLSFVPNFAFLRSITAVCRSFVIAVELISAFGAVSLVSLSWWQFERKLSDKSSPVNLGLLGLELIGDSHRRAPSFASTVGFAPHRGVVVASSSSVMSQTLPAKTYWFWFWSSPESVPDSPPEDLRNPLPHPSPTTSADRHLQVEIVPTANLPSIPTESSRIVTCFLTLAVNFVVWLGLVQPFVSSSDTYVATPSASWARFVMKINGIRHQFGSPFNGHLRFSQPLLTSYMTSEGLVSVTLLCMMQWSIYSLLLVPNYLSMRFHQFQLPQDEDVLRFKQSFARMAVLSLDRWHIGRQSLETLVPGFGKDLNRSGFISDHLFSDSDFPCIEDLISLVLTFSVVIGSVPNFGFGISCVVDRLCDGLGFTEEGICVIKSQLIQLQAHKIEEQRVDLASFFTASWMANFMGCGLEWIRKAPLMATIQQGSFSRPSVSSVLVAEVLALKVAISAALALGVSRLAYYSDCQDLFLLNAGGLAIKLEGILADISELSSKFISISFYFVPRSENTKADSLAKTSLISCIISSSDRV
ncbi:Ribonuclease H domain [Arabidopsis thaliana x Arabidopsis arenosa]|uniref:Ribonuclease H domain n=1 Tax=Arabidopsis thaliana x Arabidopsis arenosa TaxID=1240361 RepID=A0A8T2BZF4_9BRAS|nr:Ribonuclease H domain [Arabidopsis thaliana x Arabidopsis arenosa]